jgi:hypothetical protein
MIVNGAATPLDSEAVTSNDLRTRSSGSIAASAPMGHIAKWPPQPIAAKSSTSMAAKSSWTRNRRPLWETRKSPPDSLLLVTVV